jgi:integrase/recombinase XerD
MNTLNPRTYPNCNEGNTQDARFCSKCKMILTYDAYSETVVEKQEKDKQIETLIKKQEHFEQLIQSLIDSSQMFWIYLLCS